MLFHPGSKLSHLCLRACSVHCTYAASRNRRNLYLAFFRLLWDFPTCRCSLIKLCNMYVYTSKSLISALFSHGTRFIRDAVLRAGEGFFGLAIQNNRSVQVLSHLAYFSSWMGLGELAFMYITMKGNVKILNLVVPMIAKSNMPGPPFFRFLLWNTKIVV